MAGLFDRLKMLLGHTLFRANDPLVQTAENASLAPRNARTTTEHLTRRVDMPAHPLPAGNEDIIKGYRFVATMQLRTPSRILRRHGELHVGLATEPPQFCEEMWQGIWVPELKTLRELGFDLQDMPTGTMAADIGQIPADGGQFLPFLLEVRAAAEVDERPDDCRLHVASVLRRAQWRGFVASLGGEDRIVNQLFPPFVGHKARLPEPVATAVRAAGICRPVDIDAASDAKLLAIKGVGPKALATLREAAGVAADYNSAFVSAVVR